MKDKQFGNLIYSNDDDRCDADISIPYFAGKVLAIGLAELAEA